MPSDPARMSDYDRMQALIARLTADAHNETGSLREYARSLLADLRRPAPPDPEQGTPTGRAPWPFKDDDAEPFNLASSAPADPEFRPQGGPFPATRCGTCAHGGDVIHPEQMIRWVEVGQWSHVDCIPSALADPFDEAPDHTGGVTGKPGPVFEAQYDSVCPYGDKIYEGDSIRATGAGEFAHEDCVRDAGDADDE